MIFYLLFFVLVGVVWGYNSKMQGVTLNFGRYMARDNELAGPRGFQDAITPKFQDKLNSLLFVVLAVAVIGFFFFKWYTPILALFIYGITAGVAAAFAPKQLFPYIGKIIGSLARRSADYAKKGDHERSSAAKDMGQMVGESAEEIYLIYGKKATVEQLNELVNGGSPTK